MTAIVSVETVLLVLLVVLVAGLLRSHAEILRRLGPASEDEAAGGRDPAAGRARDPRRAAAEPSHPEPLVGATPEAIR